MKAKLIGRFLALPLLAAMFAAGPASAQSAQSGQSAGNASPSSSKSTGSGGASSAMSKSDQKMLEKLAQANIDEIKGGELALQKSQNPDVKSFAQKMVDDHTAALKEVQQLAQSKGVTLPQDVDTKHKAMSAALEKMSGDKFDRTYMSQGGVSDHKTAHKLVSDIASKAKDSDLKALAAKLQPTIDKHLEMAQNMKGSHADKMSGSSGERGKTQSGK